MSIINIISAIGNNKGIAPLFVRDCCIEIPAKLGLTYNQKLTFIYELEQQYNQLENSKYIETFEVIYYEYLQQIDELNNQIVDYYKELVEADYEKYENQPDDDSYAAYVKAMQNNNSKVYYHKDYGTNEKGEKKAFVAVSHVLIKLSDDQLSEISELKEKLENGSITQPEYDDEFQKVLDKTIVHVRDEKGLETVGTEVSQNVLKDFVEKAQDWEWTEENLHEKLEVFRGYWKEQGIKPKVTMWAVRAAVTGRTCGADMVGILEVIGKEKTLNRAKKAIK